MWRWTTLILEARVRRQIFFARGRQPNCSTLRGSPDAGNKWKSSLLHKGTLRAIARLSSSL